MSNVSILFVDDDQEMVDSLARWFRRKGYQTTPTYHPMQCLVAAATHDYHVAVVDVGMPDMNGLELLVELVQLKLYPVVVLSGHNDAGFKAEAIRLGAANYLVKPVSMKDLEDAIKKAIAEFAASPTHAIKNRKRNALRPV